MPNYSTPPHWGHFLRLRIKRNRLNSFCGWHAEKITGWPGCKSSESELPDVFLAVRQSGIAGDLFVDFGVASMRLL